MSEFEILLEWRLKKDEEYNKLYRKLRVRIV
jgi:hypothetical protein